MDGQEDIVWVESTAGTRTPVRGSCVIGRTHGNTIVIPNDKVSRRHAMIHAQGEAEFWLIDLGSSNGTYLNGRRVNQPCRLTDGDQVEVGGHSFTFRHPRLSRDRAGEPTTEKTIQDIKSLSCWLLVADMESSTRFVQKMPADEGARVTGRWLASCKQVIDDNGGTINKFLGDGFFAYWVASACASESVAGALTGLRKLQDESAPRFRMVLHFGQVFVGGAASLGEESLLGQEVNFVFRMEKVAASLGVACLLSERARVELKSFLTAATEERREPVPSFEGEFLFHCL